MLMKLRHRVQILLVMAMLIVLPGCRTAWGTKAPDAATTPGPSVTSSPSAQTGEAYDQNALAFTAIELFTGKEINFPAASAGRVAVLLFFSTG